MSDYEMWQPAKMEAAEAVAAMSARMDAIKATAVEGKVSHMVSL